MCIGGFSVLAVVSAAMMDPAAKLGHGHASVRLYVP
jgi:hypothetical protein